MFQSRQSDFPDLGVGRNCVNSNHQFQKPSKMNQSDLLEKEFISVNELMDLFEISRATAQRLLKSGEVRSTKLGGKVIIPTKPLKEKFA